MIQFIIYIVCSFSGNNTLKTMALYKLSLSFVYNSQERKNPTVTVFVTHGPIFCKFWFSNCLDFETITQFRCCHLKQIKAQNITDLSVEKLAKIASNFLIRQMPNRCIVKSMSISLYFVRTYYSES